MPHRLLSDGWRAPCAAFKFVQVADEALLQVVGQLLAQPSRRFDLSQAQESVRLGFGLESLKEISHGNAPPAKNNAKLIPKLYTNLAEFSGSKLSQ